MNRIKAESFHNALVAAGVLRDGESIRRIVIDAKVGEVVVIHVERFGDERLLDVTRALDGIEVREVGAYGIPPLTDPTVDPAAVTALFGRLEASA